MLIVVNLLSLLKPKIDRQLAQNKTLNYSVNELVKADGSLQLPQDISDTSLNRYRQAVQHIIKDEIDTLLIAQREKNKINPYSEDRYSIRPLWGKCLVEQ